MTHRLFYISQCKVDPCGPEPRAILQAGTRRNAELGVTGLLCCSGEHFAQILEGSPSALEALMASIRRDGRHAIAIEWPAEAAADARWFRNWSLAYLFDDRLESLLRRLLARQQAGLEQVARALMRDVDMFQASHG